MSEHNSPPVALTARQIEAAKSEYDGRVGTAVVMRRSMQLWAVSSTLVSVLLAISLWVMMPLKTVQPYVVEVNKTTGDARIVGEGLNSKAYQPDDVVKTAWLARFVTNGVGIEPSRDLTEDRIRQAGLVARGKAAEQFNQYLVKTAPIKTIVEDPNFSRRVTVRNVTFVRNTNTAAIQFRVEDQTLGRPAVTRAYIMKADYAFDPPKNITEIQQNPLGMFVIDFVINEDVR
ncbi:MAG: type IV secretion system protein [Casimicrobium sp.]